MTFGLGLLRGLGGVSFAEATPCSRTLLAETFLSHRAELDRFLVSRVRDAHIAEDLAQDMWVRLHSVWELPAKIRQPRSFLFRIAHNLVIDHIRAEKARAALNAEACALVFEGLDDVILSDRQVIGIEEMTRVKAVVAALPPRTAEIFTMNRMDGIPYRKIALRLGISTTAVEKHMRRALDALGGLRDEALGLEANDDGAHSSDAPAGVGQKGFLSVID